VSRITRTKLSILFAISILAGIIIFLKFEYSPFTLAIQTKTLEKGRREIVAIDHGGKEQRIPLEIGDDSGVSAVYSIELPRKLLKKVTIPPLAAPGRYEIERLTLANRAISYQWDGATNCSSRKSSDPVGFHSPCSAGSPAVSVSEESSIIITEIPVAGVLDKSSSRVGKAALVAVLIFLSGLYLMRPIVAGTARADVSFERAGWLLVILLYLYQLSMIWGYSVDLPFWEEWEFFEPDALQRGLSFEWLFRHFGTNQQVVVFTKLMAWLDFKLFSLDFIKLKVMNYLVFGLFLAALVRFARQVGNNGFKLLPLFMLFLVSPLAYEAHAASFQSGEIFVLLFSMWMLCFFLTGETGYRDTLLFSLCSLGAMFSMHTGVAVAAILLVARTVFMAFNAVRNELDKRKVAVNLLTSWLITLSGIIYWLSGYRKPSNGAPPWLLPTEGKFWNQFFNLLAFGFGFDSPGPFPGILVLLLLLLPLILLVFNSSTRWQRTTWQILPAILALIALTAMITLGRGNMDGSIKLSRYTVYISPLIPFGALAWWLAMRGKRELFAALGIFWLLCAGAFADNWGYAIYRDLRQMDIMNLECVESYNSGKGDGNCPDTHGVPIGGFFDNARKLDISFTRQFSRYGQPK